MAQGPWFSLHLTDGDRSHIPNSQQELQYGYEPANQALTQKAYENIAKEIIKNAGGGKLEKGMAYDKLPDGYSLWYHERADGGRKDWYICGHPGHIKFDSFAQFAIHMNHLQKLDQALGTCVCKVCKRSPLTRDSLVRRQWEPPSIIPPGDEASVEDEREGEEEEDGGEEDEGEEDGGEEDGGEEDGGEEDGGEEDEGEEDEGEEDGGEEDGEEEDGEEEDGGEEDEGGEEVTTEDVESGVAAFFKVMGVPMTPTDPEHS